MIDLIYLMCFLFLLGVGGYALKFILFLVYKWEGGKMNLKNWWKNIEY